MAPTQGQQPPSVSLPLGSDSTPSATQNTAVQAAGALQNVGNVQLFAGPDGQPNQGIVSTLFVLYLDIC